MKQKLKNQFRADKFCSMVRRRYKKRFKKVMPFSDADVMREISLYLNEIMDEVIKGKKVILDKHSYIQVIGAPAVENKTYARLVSKGLIFNGKRISKITSIPRRRDIVYGIEYVNTITDKRIYFDPHKDFKKRLRKSLEETNTHYHIVTKNCNFLDGGEKVTKNRN